MVDIGAIPRVLKRTISSGAREPSRDSRRFVIGDIHGCSQTFRALCREELHVAPPDVLYLLGDLVSKGPDSIGVLTYLDQLIHEGISVTIVRGNHEEAILRATRAGKGTLRRMLERTNNSALLDKKNSKRIDPRWERLFSGSQYIVFLPEAILVHGGIDLTQPDPFSNRKDFVQRRETLYDSSVADGRIVIHGHTRTPLSTITEQLVTQSPVLSLDNGAVGATNKKPFKISEYGNLCCYELGTKILHVQPNRDVAQNDKERPSYCVRIQAYGRG